MQLASFTARPPQLILALEALARREGKTEIVESLLQELSGITVLVAKKFTNDKTADGMQEAFYLTMGCLSLAISQADIPATDEAKLSFLLEQGAEYVFQMGFRRIKELSALPYVAFISDFDNDAFVQQRNIKALFTEICRCDPAENWAGDEVYQNECKDRQQNKNIIACAQWLRKNHFAGAILESDLDANAVIALVVIFAIAGDGRIVARAGQKEIESLIYQVRETTPDIDAAWKKLLKKIPAEHHDILRARMEAQRGTIIKKICSKTKIKTVVTEIQNFYAGNELDVDYP